MAIGEYHQWVKKSISGRLSLSEVSSVVIPLKTIVSEHGLLLHQHMPVKTLLCEEKLIYKQDPEIQSSKSSICDDMGCIYAHGVDNLHICEGSINAE